MTCLCELKTRVLVDIRRNHRSLSLKQIEEPQFAGLYAIWYRHRCIYVGQSDQQTVYDRLYAHLSNCHNEFLRLWIRVKDGTLRFTSSTVDEMSYGKGTIRRVEVYLIRTLNPETNKQRPGGTNG